MPSRETFAKCLLEIVLATSAHPHAGSIATSGVIAVFNDSLHNARSTSHTSEWDVSCYDNAIIRVSETAQVL